MIYLILTLLSLSAQARECYLSQDQSGTMFVDCRIGAVPPEYKRICPMVGEEKDGSVYKIEIANQNDGLIEKAKELIGLDAKKEWTPGYELEKGEFIECSVDSTKVEAKEAQKAAREAAETAKKNKDKSDWEAACVDSKDPVSALICKERGY